MKETDDMCLFVFASIAPNQVNTGMMMMMVGGGGTEMPAMHTENMVLKLKYSIVTILVNNPGMQIASTRISDARS